MQVKEYLKEDGSSPYSDWLRKLDGALKYRVQARIVKLKDDGHFGVTKRLAEDLYELKCTFGGGVRIYYGMDQEKVLILLCGGNKGSQAKDIKMAHKYWDDYKKRDEKE